MEITDEATVGSGRPIYVAFNRGVIVGAAYGAILIVVGLFLIDPSALDQWPTIAGVVAIGTVTGAIGGFSNTLDGESGRRDLLRNLADAGMIVTWTSALVLATNLVFAMAVGVDVLSLLAAFAGATVAGGVFGEPLLEWIGQASIKGHRPFLFVNEVTRGIRNADTQLVVRVLLQTLVVGLLALLAMVVAVVVIGLVALAIAFLILAKVLEGEGGSSTRTRVQYPRGPAHPGGTRGESRRVDGLFGPYTVHADSSGAKTGESRDVDGPFGKHTEHRDANGNKTGESREVDGLFSKHTEHRDANGNKTGESREVDGLFSKHTEHRPEDD